MAMHIYSIHLLHHAGNIIDEKSHGAERGAILGNCTEMVDFERRRIKQLLSEHWK
jgi:hypothetical protein